MKPVHALSSFAHGVRRRGGARLFPTVLLAAVLLLSGWFAHQSVAQVYNVDTAVGTGTGSLYWAIQQADAFGNGATISFQNLPFAQVNLDDPLPDITVGVTINGNSTTVSGENQRRIFFVNTPAGQIVQLNGLTLANGLAQGGNGNQGGGTGGGGAGLGGAVFVNAGAVTFSSVAFQNNSAVGGQGGSGGFGGGGGGGAKSSAGINASSNGNGGTGGGAHGAMPGLAGAEDPRGLSTSLADGGGGLDTCPTFWFRSAEQAATLAAAAAGAAASSIMPATAAPAVSAPAAGAAPMPETVMPAMAAAEVSAGVAGAEGALRMSTALAIVSADSADSADSAAAVVATETKAPAVAARHSAVPYSFAPARLSLSMTRRRIPDRSRPAPAVTARWAAYTVEAPALPPEARCSSWGATPPSACRPATPKRSPAALANRAPAA
jgi:hypothetical protein